MLLLNIFTLDKNNERLTRELLSPTAALCFFGVHEYFEIKPKTIACSKQTFTFKRIHYFVLQSS